MKTFSHACSLLLVAFAAAPAIAQEIEPVLINDLPPEQLARQQQAHAVETSEDLEVMAAILRENLLELYGGPHAGLGGQSGLIAKPLGERLPGYGVVLQVEVPAPRAQEEKPSPEKPALSRWERTQRRLRGEPVPPADGARACAQCHDQQALGVQPDFFFSYSPGGYAPAGEESRSDQEDVVHGTLHLQSLLGGWTAKNRPTQPSLVDALVDTLAENGTHFRHLAADERVAFSVSFRPAPVVDSAHAAGAAETTDADLRLAFTDDGTLMSNNQELTGDLLVKQGQYARAIEAYSRVLNRVREANKGKPAKNWPEPQRRLLQKLIEACIAAGQERQVPQTLLNIIKNNGHGNQEGTPAASDSTADLMVRRVFLDVFGRLPTPAEYKSLGEGEERSWNLTKLVATALSGKPEASGSAARLPVRIRISATKGALDALANGTLTRDEFRRKVETSIVDPRRGS